MLENRSHLLQSFESRFISLASTMNYPIKNFELIDISKIASNQYHTALIAMEKQLIISVNFYNGKKVEYNKWCNYFTSLMLSDIEIYSKLIEQLKVIDSLENTEKINNQHKYKLLKEICLKIEKIIENNSANFQQKPSPQHKLKYNYSIIQNMKTLVLNITEQELKKSIETLKIKKDQIEIIVLSSLTKILLDKEIVTPKEIYNLISQHSNLISKMNSYELNENVKFNAISMDSEIKKAKQQIDQLQRFENSNTKNYEHLSILLKWVTYVIDLTLNQKYHKKLSLYFNTSLNKLEIYGRISNILNREIQDIQTQIDRKENLDTIKKLIYTIEEIKFFITKAIENENTILITNRANDDYEVKLNESLFQEQK